MKKYFPIIFLFILGFLLGFFLNNFLNNFKKIPTQKENKRPIISPTQPKSASGSFNEISPTSLLLTHFPVVSPSSLPSIFVPYQPQATWAIFKDEVVGFSFQYKNNPETGDKFNFYLKIAQHELGKSVVVQSCFTPPEGPSANKTVCRPFFNINIYDNYDGGSRRIWFKKNIKDKVLIGECRDLPDYYADIYINKVKGLLFTSECFSSFGVTYILIPKRQMMIVISQDNFAFDRGSKKIKIEENFYKVLSTFKF